VNDDDVAVTVTFGFNEEEWQLIADCLPKYSIEPDDVVKELALAGARFY